MTRTDTLADTQAIVIDEVFPHSAATLWRALTSGELIGRWLMPAAGFAAEVGTRFTFSTKPAGAWDGTIRCEVLEVVPQRRLAWSWRGGDAGNVGYGSELDTLVTWLLTPVEAGTRLRLVHSGFELPRNEVAYSNMSSGWKVVLTRLGDAAGEE